ncbi:TRAP transporter small permease [Oceaniglobus trochenteri]|uniref:TRAP transporter small permease n=1 Tax=Oceaniglobus trochenteri TaxID=2763260 RepID=UPI001CFF578F|nr:TRAP transporter small permease subunit [Oceaniglobus trochenteri]
MKLATTLRTMAEAVAAAMMALMFLTFVLQIAVRYSARIGGLAERFPLLDPSHYGWTLEFCLLLWIWLVFWGNAFVVRNRDHVTFDILYLTVPPGLRRWFAIIGGLAICIGLLLSIGPTMEKFHILRLKKTATLSSLFGDWIRMRDIYSVYILFLGVVALRYAWGVYHAFRYGVEVPEHDT